MFQLLLFAVLSVTVYTNDIKQILEIPPAPMPGFNINADYVNAVKYLLQHFSSPLYANLASARPSKYAYLGRWFIQFRRAPCSWPGSSTFTDYEQNVIPTRKGGISGHVTWRSRGICNSITDMYMMPSPGVFTYIDNIGDSASGSLIVAAIDKKHFIILWGCTKMAAAGDRCEDPLISISTRLRIPPPGVLNMIEKILRTRWGITIGDLQKVPHKMPCQSNFHKKG